MTEPVRTRADVERAVRDALTSLHSLVHAARAAGPYPSGRSMDENVERGKRAIYAQMSAALLAMAECDTCGGSGNVDYDVQAGEIVSGPCVDCMYGLDQARLARGLKALEGR